MIGIFLYQMSFTKSLSELKINGSSKNKKMPTKILHIIDSLEYGGAQKLLLLLTKYIPRDQYNFYIVVLQDKVQLSHKFLKQNANLVLFKRSRPSILKLHKFLQYVFMNLRDIIKLCLAEKVDIIHCHLSDAEFLGVIASMLLDLRKVYITIHVSRLFPPHSQKDPRLFLRKWVMRLLYKYVAGIICVSNQVKEEVVKITKVPRNKVHTIVNAVETSIFSDKPDVTKLKQELKLDQSIRILLHIGRLNEAKGQIYLLRAVKKLVQKFPSLKLLMVGEGELKEPLVKETIDLGIENQVLFLGVRDDIPELLSLAQIFVFPSLHEGTPLSLIEAMAAGKGIVATNIPPHKVLLKDGESALLVPPADADSLAEAIERLLNSPELSSSLGAMAQKVAKERYDISVMVEELIKIWG